MRVYTISENALGMRWMNKGNHSTAENVPHCRRDCQDNNGEIAPLNPLLKRTRSAAECCAADRIYLVSHRCCRPAAYETVAPTSRSAVVWTSRSTLVSFQNISTVPDLRAVSTPTLATKTRTSRGWGTQLLCVATRAERAGGGK